VVYNECRSRDVTHGPRYIVVLSRQKTGRRGNGRGVVVVNPGWWSLRRRADRKDSHTRVMPNSAPRLWGLQARAWGRRRRSGGARQRSSSGILSSKGRERCRPEEYEMERLMMATAPHSSYAYLGFLLAGFQLLPHQACETFPISRFAHVQSRGVTSSVVDRRGMSASAPQRDLS
jgi:hypothetical protein